MKRSPLPRARSRIKPMSDRRRAQNKERREALIAAYGTDPVCFVPHCWAPAWDGHELLSRARGGSITDVSNVRPVCRPHHRAITANPSWAQEMGFALPSRRRSDGQPPG